MIAHNLIQSKWFLFILFCTLFIFNVVLLDPWNLSKVQEVTNTKQVNNQLSTDFNQLQNWANSLPELKKEDSQRTNLLFQELSGLPNVKDQFYQVVNQPLQTSCSVGKFFGGQWLGKCGSFDGNKFVCLDKLYQDVLSANCLIYSFGVAGDWSFEEAMAAVGCQIKAFDPTTEEASKPENENITFSKIGLSAKSATLPNLGPVLTLKDSMALMGDTGKRISYLKVDIEGSEFEAIPDWIDSGVLELVSQIGIEIHTSQADIQQQKVKKTLNKMLQNFRRLNKLGFRLISSTNNGCMGKDVDYDKQYYTLMEVVFHKI